MSEQLKALCTEAAEQFMDSPWIYKEFETDTWEPTTLYHASEIAVSELSEKQCEEILLQTDRKVISLQAQTPDEFQLREIKYISLASLVSIELGKDPGLSGRMSLNEALSKRLNDPSTYN